MKKQTRTSKKQIHELEAMARESIDQSARLYARYEKDATGKAYAIIGDELTEYKSNTALYDAVAEMIMKAEEAAAAAAEAEQETAPEYIEPEHIQTVSGHKIYRSIDPVTGWNVFTVAGRDFWELAEARYFAQCNPAPEIIHDAEPVKHHDGITEVERPTYQRYELEAFLGAFADDYDVDAIEAEATEHDPKTGRAMWTPEAVRDLWSICERHELKA